MIHQPSGGAQGQATDIQIQAEEILKMKKQINSIYVKHTGQDLTYIGKIKNFKLLTCTRLFLLAHCARFLYYSEANMERDKFMNPIEAKLFGLIDTVLEHPPKMHNSDENLHQHRLSSSG